MVFTTKVDTGKVFVAGDWRGNSRDSRLYTDSPGNGGVPLTDIRGIVVAVNNTVLAPTTAFTDAGLAGAPYQEASFDKLVLAGGVVFVGGLVWLVLSLIRRKNATV
ncbi:hypothetical protein EV192_106495 [Actinocrispum wychmicini]|uniref:Uncharacterized protein n=2 Tax=Actinocrispum wychmicini TaxID=1213861 RepID=A0A4V6NNV5_9PSEU|nr:hypothetical protein EV192_106495 [Actinocrispum wychmicini]